MRNQFWPHGPRTLSTSAAFGIKQCRSWSTKESSDEARCPNGAKDQPQVPQFLHLQTPTPIQADVQQANLMHPTCTFGIPFRWPITGAHHWMIEISSGGVANTEFTLLKMLCSRVVISLLCLLMNLLSWIPCSKHRLGFRSPCLVSPFLPLWHIGINLMRATPTMIRVGVDLRKPTPTRIYLCLFFWECARHFPFSCWCVLGVSVPCASRMKMTM